MAIIKYKTNSNTWVPVQLTVPTIEVDSILSDTSTNPVQNKVIKEALDRKVDINAISRVAISGDYSDLDNLPTFATINGQDITQTDHIIIKDKIYPIYSKRLLGQETLNPAQIIANKNAYDSVLANENAVYYFVTNNPNLILMSTQINVLDQSIVFISNITGHSNEEFNIVEVHLTIKPDGNSEELLSNINLLTKDKTQDLLNSKQDSLISGVNIKTINNQSILIENEDITNIQISSDMTVDSVISDTSENPVQNKVVKNYVDGVVNNITLPIVDSLDSESTTEALSANQGRVLKGLVDGKMDSTTFKTINGNVITGEGNLVVREPKYNIHIATSGELSSEQKSENKILFDLAESGNPVSICYSDKQPLFYRGSKSSDGELETISYIANNYLDVLNSGTVMQELLVQVDIDSQGNAYPNNNTHTYYLDNVTAINSKQDTLVSGTNIKTIDNQSLLGSGNIITKTEIIDTLESTSTTAALSANQGKVLKEMIENVPSGGDEGTKVCMVYYADGHQEENKKAYEAVKNADDALYYIDYEGYKYTSLVHAHQDDMAVFVSTQQHIADGEATLVNLQVILSQDGLFVHKSNSGEIFPSTTKVQEMISASDESEGVTVVDNLNSESATAALSAKQGKVLKDMINNIPSGEGGGGNKIDVALSLSSGNPVTNTVITSNIGVRVIEMDINTSQGWQQVLNTLTSQANNYALIPVLCKLDESPAYVYTLDTLGPNNTVTSLIAICNGKTYVIPSDTGAIEYPFVFTDNPSKKTDNQIRAWIKNDVWNEAVLEIDGIRYLANGLTQETGYLSFKVVVGNELRTYFVYTANVGDIEAGTLTLVNTEYIGSGGGDTADLYPSEYSDEFNDDFTN